MKHVSDSISSMTHRGRWISRRKIGQSKRRLETLASYWSQRSPPRIQSLPSRCLLGLTRRRWKTLFSESWQDNWKANNVAKQIFALFLFLIIAKVAYAHKPSDSYLSLETNGNKVSGQWDI